eukprot:202449-Pyramimonas_sp.AAC.1
MRFFCRVIPASHSHHCASLASHVPVSACVQRFAPAVRGKHARLVEHGCGVGKQRQVDSACKPGGALLGMDGLAGEMNCHQGGGAGGVHAEGGAMEPEGIGESACRHAQHSACCSERMAG